MKKDLISTIVRKYYSSFTILIGTCAIVGVGLFAFVSCKSDNKYGKGIQTQFDKAVFDLNALKYKQNLVSMAIIGSGPAGMMAGVYGARALRDALILEGDKPGGLLMDTTDVENWPGEDVINGPDIMDKLRLQAKKLGTSFLQESVESVDFSQWPYTIITDNGTQLHALSVIIATGATPKRLGIPGEEENWGSGVSACAVCDAAFFRNKEVMVIGGGDSAVEEAIQLSPYVKKVTIMVRKDSMRAAASMQNRLKNYANIQIAYNVELEEILNNSKGFVTDVIVYNNKEKKKTKVSIDGIFLAVGHNPNTEIFKGKLAMDPEGHILVVDRTQKTSLAGVFAAGDVEDNMYRQAGIAAASGIKAALDADQFLASVGITKDFLETVKNQLFVPTVQSSKSNNIVPLKTLKELEAHSNAKDATTFVMFYSDNCNTSMQMIPVFQAFARENTESFFGMVNSDEATDLAKHFFVHNVPCIFAFKNGTLIGRCNGLISEHQLQEFADSLNE